MTVKAKIGFLDFNDERKHVLKETFKSAQRLKGDVVAALEKTGKIELVDPATSFRGFDKMVWRVEIARKQAKMLAEADINGLILHYSLWASPRLARMAVQILLKEYKKKKRSIPILVLTNLAPEQPGMVGGMAAAGGLDQLGIPNLRIWSKDVANDPEKLKQVVEFAVFAQDRAEISSSADEVVERLHGQVYGEIGGRSIQIVTAEADPLQWTRIFGVDIQPIGQLEIVRKANEMLSWSNGINSTIREVKEVRISKAFNFLTHYAAGVNYEDRFTEDKLKYQLACYYATQDIIAENEFDFIGVKCQPELSEYHVTQCLTQAFSNDSRGPAGEEKRIVVCSCEDDKDAAMTQQIMYLLSGRPTMFADFRHLDPERDILYLVNCGAHTPWFATRTDKVEANLAKIELNKQAFFYAACGATIDFDAAAGPVTGARLGRKNGRYWMNIVPGEFVKRPANAVTTTSGWPHAFMKFKVPMEQLFQEHPCNHIQVVAGDYVAGLVEVCEKLGIGYKVQDRNLGCERIA